MTILFEAVQMVILIFLIKLDLQPSLDVLDIFFSETLPQLKIFVNLKDELSFLTHHTIY